MCAVAFILSVHLSHAQIASNYIFSQINYLESDSHVWDVHEMNDGNLVILSPSRLDVFDGHSCVKRIKVASLNRKLYWSEKNTSFFGSSYFGISPRPLTENDGDFTRAEALKAYRFGKMVFHIENDFIYVIDDDNQLCKVPIEGGKKEILLKLDVGVQVKQLKSVNGFFFYSTKDRVYRINSETLERQIVYRGKSDFLRSRSNKLAFLSGSTLYTMDADTYPAELKKFEVGGTDVKDIVFNDKGVCWLASDSKIVRIDQQNQIERISLPKKMEVEKLRFFENEDCLLICTAGDGVLRMDRKSLSLIPLENEKRSVSSLACFNERTLVVANNGPLYEFKNNKIDRLSDSEWFFSATNSINDSLIVSSYNAEHFLFDEKVSPIDLGVGKEMFIKAIRSTYNDRYYISSGKGLYSCTNTNDVKPILPDKIYGLTIDVIELHNGDICFGQERRVGVFSPKSNTVKFFSISESESAEVRALYQDDQGIVWIGTYGNGLYCLDGDQLTHVQSKENCMLSKDIFTLAYYKEHLLMSSNNGLFIVSLSDLRKFLSGEIHFLVPFVLTETSGGETNEFNGMLARNYAYLDEETLLFASINGVIKFQGDLPKSKANRKLEIRNATYKGKAKTIQKLKLRESDGTLKVELGCSNFSNSDQQYFQYRWKASKGGKDKKWSPLQASNVFYLQPPDHGTYFLEFRMVDASNDANESYIRYHVNVLPKFINSNGFLFLIIALIVVALIATLVIRRYILKRKKKREEKFKLELTDLKNEIANSKLNPHFLFNSLNGLHSLLALEEYEKVETLIPEFSGLLRYLVDGESGQAAKLKDELDFIQMYLNVEQMRIGERLEFSVSFSEKSHNYKIPRGMILPFVENAIVHGVSNTKTKSFVNLRVITHDSTLFIEIENSIGNAIAPKKREGHVSKGISFVDDIVSNWNSKSSSKISYKVTIEDIALVEIKMTDCTIENI